MRTEAEWKAWRKTNERPPDIPAVPWRTYADEWRGIRDWLGTEHLGRFPLAVPGSRELSLMLCRLSSFKSQTTHARFEADPGEWWRFHELFNKSRMRWPEEPTRYVAHLISQEVPRGARVVDLGCGQCLLRDALPEYEITGVDHVAYDSSVCACDMAQIPLGDASFDVAVFCLSLLGRNWPDYLTEGRRILRPGGRLFIVESRHRWERMCLEEHITGLGFTEIRVEARAPYYAGSFVYAQARLSAAGAEREEVERMTVDIVERAEWVEAELDRLVERRSRNGEVDPIELEPSYAESVRCYHARRNEEVREQWQEFHRRMQSVHEDLARGHQEQLSKLKRGEA